MRCTELTLMPLELGHRGGGPVRRLARRIGLGRGDDARRNLGFERRNARRPRLVAQQARDTIGHEAFLPAPDSRLADAGVAHDLGRAAAVRRQQHDLGPPDMLLRAVPVRHDRVQLATIRGTHVNFDAGAHPADSHVSENRGNPQFGLKCQILSTSTTLAESRYAELNQFR